MKLTEDIRGLTKTYTGERGEAILSRNFGNKDKGDKWSVSVIINGEYKRLANRVDFNKAFQMAESEIG